MDEGWKPQDPECPFCDDTGIMTCIHLIKRGEWVFKCDCPAGKNKGGNFPYLTSEKIKKGFRPLTQDELIRHWRTNGGKK